MEEKKYCSIVQDLLPNYIEKLTNEETNIFVEEHLKECEECKEKLENMQKELKVNTQKIDKREVKYIKKFNNKLKILKFIIIIIVAIVVSILGRKIFILNDLKNKVNEKAQASNYHIEYYSYRGKINFSLSDVYVKDNKYLYKNKIISDISDYTQLIEYYDGKVAKTMYMDSHGEKNIFEKEEPFAENLTKIQNFLYTDNVFCFMFRAIRTSIITEKCNGIDCYRIYSEGQILYIDKDTGLPIRITRGSTVNEGRIVDIITDYFYEFDSVTDEMLNFKE